jgi:hypothetical protein
MDDDQIQLRLLPAPEDGAVGWHPLSRPDDQAFWDGTTWTERRHWDRGAWVAGPMPNVELPMDGMIAQRSLHASLAEPSPSPLALNVSDIVVFLAGVMAIVGSVTTWLSISIGANTLSVDGTGPEPLSSITPGTGWATFALGLVLLVLGCLRFVSKARSLRWLALIGSIALAGLSIYDLVRLEQTTSKANGSLQRTLAGHQPDLLTSLLHASVGYGIYLVVIASLVALIASVVSLTSSR